MIQIQTHHKPDKPILSCEDSPHGCPEAPKESKGLGDRVEQIAQPIAKVIDRVAGTNVQNCGGCKKRKAWLNEKFPPTAPKEP